MTRLTGPRAWTLSARVRLAHQPAEFPDAMSTTDWRKTRAIATGTVVEITTY